MSRTTSELLDQQVRATGVKKGHLVEQALHHHLRAFQELPADAIVRPTPVVTRKSGWEILKQLGKGKPTRALRQLAARLAPALEIRALREGRSNLASFGRRRSRPLPSAVRRTEPVPPPFGRHLLRRRRWLILAFATVAAAHVKIDDLQVTDQTPPGFNCLVDG